MEFQAVILAAGRGSRMTDLTVTTPKPLLPIANMPLIWYSTKMLENAGFEEAIIVCQRAHQNDISKALQDCCNLKLQYVSIQADDDWGTADSLRHLQDRITSRDLLLVSCDLITDVPLHRLVDIHRTHNASVTMLLGNLPDMAEISVPGGKANRKQERDLVGLDSKTGRVIFFSAEADFEENVSLRKSLLKRHPCISMHSRLLDGHLYLMKRWVLDLLIQEPSIATVKGELVPYLVRQQFSQPKSSTAEAITDPSIVPLETKRSVHDLAEEDPMMSLALELSTCPGNQPIKSSDTPRDKISCYSYIHKEGLCIRANSLATYCEANRQVPRQLATFHGDKEFSMVHPSASKHQKSTIGPESLVGEGTQIAEKVGVKRCCIGAGCKIDEKSKITGSILLDRVTVGADCTISGCVIGDNVNIGEKTELKDCLVGSRQNIMPMGKFSNDVIVDVNRMMEI